MSWRDRLEERAIAALAPLGPHFARWAPVDEQGRAMDAHVAILARAGRIMSVPTSRLTTERFRADAMRQSAYVDVPPDPEIDVEELEVPVGSVRLPARLYTRRGHRTTRLMVGLHEGGWVIGGLFTNATLFSRIARAGVAVLDVGYRHAPEEPWPIPFQDALAAFRWTRANARERFGVSPDRVGVGGASAGGASAAAICVHERDHHRPLPAWQLLVYPQTDATARDGSMLTMADAFPLTLDLFYWFIDRVAPSPALRRDLRMSPGLSGSLAGLPPAVMAVAGFDILRDQALDYARRLQEDGVPCDLLHFPALTHSFAIMAGAVPAASDALDAIAEATASRL